MAQQARVDANQKFTISKSFISVEDGLASYEVFCGMQGFLWFGTRNGLNRYDGEVTKDTVIAFTQKDALRSLPIGFNSKHELLLIYITTAAPNKYQCWKYNS